MLQNVTSASIRDIRLGYGKVLLYALYWQKVQESLIFKPGARLVS